MIGKIRKQKTTRLDRRRECLQVREGIVEVLEDFAHNQQIACRKLWDGLVRRAIAKGHRQLKSAAKPLQKIFVHQGKVGQKQFGRPALSLKIFGQRNGCLREAASEVGNDWPWLVKNRTQFRRVFGPGGNALPEAPQELYPCVSRISVKDFLLAIAMERLQHVLLKLHEELEWPATVSALDRGPGALEPADAFIETDAKLPGIPFTESLLPRVERARSTSADETAFHKSPPRCGKFAHASVSEIPMEDVMSGRIKSHSTFRRARLLFPRRTGGGDFCDAVLDTRAGRIDVDEV